MGKLVKYVFGIVSFVATLLVVWLSSANIGAKSSSRLLIPGPPDSLKYPLKNNDPLSRENNRAMYLKNPKNTSTDVQYDPKTNQYKFIRKIGDSTYYGTPEYMDFKDYVARDFDNAIQNYWKERAASTSIGQGKKGGFLQNINLGSQVMDKIFGSSTIDIRPQGSAELIFGVNASRRDDPALDEKNRKTANFDFQEKIQLNVTAKIGDKIQLATNYNTEASFDFENKMKLQYEGKEDEIIKKIEAGDVTLPLSGSLITGSQALFGLKTQLQFGKTTVTSVLSQQKSKTSTIEVSGGAQKSYYKLKADQYDENRHFFISQYFRDNFETAVSKLPIISSPINITKIEVWVKSIGPAINESRNIIAFQDIGENKTYNSYFSSTLGQHYPSNASNNLYDLYKSNPLVRSINTANSVLSTNLVSGIDFEKVENARKLSSNEYTFNSKLGFISLNSALSADEVLAVAYEYSVIGDPTIYQVGEFSNGSVSAPNALIVKLLKSTAINPKIPLWKLMMKNVYAIGAYQVNSQDFRLDILYSNDATGVPAGYISEGAIKGVSLLRVFQLDKLNAQRDTFPDGMFDFIDGAQTTGGTINATNGKIFFPKLEPFGSYIYNAIGNPQIAGKYAFTALYDSTKTIAQQYPEKNKFYLSGSYKSSVTSEISLNAMNVPQGSVTVTSGGIKLTENVDYTVDYALGRVKVINEGIMSSGNPIRISLESNEMFNLQTKTLIGFHADHKVSNDFRLGLTMINLTERPLTQKINIGDDPISNTIWGIDGTYQTESRFVTRMLDKLPFYSTKEVSKFTVSGEFAQLIPGHSKAIGKSGTSYIDDFEGSKSSIDLKNIGAWKIASTPQGQEEMGLFPEAAPNTGLKYGFNRAKLSWYVIDRLFNDFDNRTPAHIKSDKIQQSNHYVRGVMETEVFPNADPPNGQPIRLAVLNLAYYPGERGPYNYDVTKTSVSAGIAADGTLNNPDTRWGGIMRKVETTDFEATNVEYIEFWMMDPFAYTNGEGGNPLHSGGDMYLNLGDVSEDILRDSRKSYENGLPISALTQNVDTTAWGRVPNLQALVNTFDNDPTARQYQDVGIDGLSDADERTFFSKTYLDKIANAFGSNSQAYINANNDPSADDYHYYQGSDYDNGAVSILDRYKKFNGMEANSPTSSQSPESYPTQATTMPDIEDINRDNTLNEAERYFQYKIKLNPKQMVVGQNYITDELVAPVQLKDGTSTTCKWYQFKVPINSYGKIIGSIQDFKSIRFMRLFLKGFSEPVILRFATMELVRSEWRKYNRSLMAVGETEIDARDAQFELSAVNIEENGKRKPIPYTLPPNIEREIAFGTTNLQRMNEQSLSMKVCNLQDGDARAIYKTTDFDIRQYKKLKMFVHAETVNSSDILNNGDMTAFIRLGTDFNSNYYEYEVPLTFTPWGTTIADGIWPTGNQIELVLSKLQDAKQLRNIAMREENSTITALMPYTVTDGVNRITVVGMPNLSAVKTIMIGIRNPKQTTLTGVDDGLSKCSEVWFNELRLSDFEEKGGWAANARISGNLADLGNISLAGRLSTPGFGGIEQKLDQRRKDNYYQYDIATSLELGKFFPVKSGIKIPMHFDYSEIISNPEYLPMDPDVKFKDAIKSYATKSERDSVKRMSQDYTQRKSINFINVKKNKTKLTSKPHVYDISNFDVSYAYTEQFKRNIDIEYNLQKTYKGGLGYNFASNPKSYEPFKKIKLVQKSKYLKLLKDFNFSLMPKIITFRSDIDRYYSEAMIRNTSGFDLLMVPSYDKKFNWNRQYVVKYDITKSLKFDFTANNIARIDEPQGAIDKSESDYKQKRQEILDNISNFGRTTSYNHDASVNYTLPINKINLLNWITVNTKYSAQYRWTAAPSSTAQLGNSIENSNSKQLNGSFNMTTLYNKIGYLKKLNTPAPPKPKKAVDAPKDTTKAEKVNYAKLILDNTLKLMMGIKNASLTYTETNGTFLPGYVPKTQVVGQDWNLNAPGVPFIVGWQEAGFVEKAGANGWISKDKNLNTAYTTRYAQNISGRVMIEPFKDFKIDLNATRNYTRNSQKYYKADSVTGEFKAYSPTEGGNFTMTILALKTSFKKDSKAYESTVFDQFKANREIIASRLASENPNWDKGHFTDTVTKKAYPNGYGPTSQNVLIPAFLAAYSGKSAEKIGLSAFPAIPLPNWRVTYAGLTKIEFFKRYFKTFTVGHGYRCNYNVGSYVSNVNYEERDGFSMIRQELGYRNYLVKDEIGAISISEQFGPLLSLDMTWNNSLSTKVEVKKSRDLSLSMTNNQLTEVRGSEFVVGLGYRIKNVQFAIKSGGKTTRLKSDLNLVSNVSVRTNKTVLRKLSEDVNQVSSGQRVVSINTSADYQINQRFTIRFFFDKVINNPFVSSQFPNANTHSGISLRFSLAQ